MLQPKENIELRSKCEKLSNIKIVVSEDVYDKAEIIANKMNTYVEAIFAIAAYRLIDQRARQLFDTS